MYASGLPQAAALDAVTRQGRQTYLRRPDGICLDRLTRDCDDA
ncbi:hypothetical protein [Arthrobacter sp. SDTb3-6]